MGLPVTAERGEHARFAFGDAFLLRVCPRLRTRCDGRVYASNYSSTMRCVSFSRCSSSAVAGFAAVLRRQPMASFHRGRAGDASRIYRVFERVLTGRSFLL